MKEITKALIRARAHFQPIRKTKTNPHFRSSYADYDSLQKATEIGLVAEGLAIAHLIQGGALVTRLLHVSGEAIESSFPLPDIADPQKIGSAITYGRRYNLSCLLDLCADEDDDGNAHKGAGAQRGKGSSVSPTRASTQETPVAPRSQPDRRRQALDYFWNTIKKEIPAPTGTEFSVDWLRVIKDLTGEGKTEKLADLKDEELAEILRIDKDLGFSRFQRTIALVKRGIRRPDSVDPVFWPPGTDEMIPAEAHKSDDWDPETDG